MTGIEPISNGMKVLVIEDEVEISKFIKKGLEAEAFVVDVAFDGEEGVQLAVINVYDVIILDFYLPKMNGMKVARRIRESKESVPIIVLTVEIDIENKVEMLSLCDDYITKPFSLQELIARIRAITRRGVLIQNDLLEVGDICMDVKAYKVSRAGKSIELRNKEFALLEYFLRNPGIVLSRGMILENVWDMNVDPFTNTVDVHIRLLRQKIDNDFRKKMIKTVPKRGYKLEA